MLRRIVILTIMLCLVLTAKGQDDAEDEESNPVVDSLLREYATATSDTARVRLCREIGFKSANPDTVIKYCTIGVSLFNGKESAILANLYGYLGWAYMFKEQNPQSIECYKKAIDICQAMDSAKYSILLSINLSQSYRQNHNYSEMWLALYNALRAAQQTSDTVNICYCYYMIAVGYEELKMKQQSIDAALKGFQLAEKAHHKDDMGICASDISSVLCEDTDVESCREAVKWGHRAVECLSETEDPYYLSVKNFAYNYLIRAYICLAEMEGNAALIDSASYYIGKNEELFDVLVDDDTWIMTQQNKIRVKYAKHDYKGAEKMLIDVMKYADESGIHEYDDDTYLYLSETYDKLGDYRNALKYYELYRAVNGKKTGTRAMIEAAAFEVKSQVELEQEEADYEKRNAEKELEDGQRHFRRMMIVSTAGFVASLVFVFFLWKMLQNTRKGNAALMSHNEEIKTQNEELNIEKAKFADINNKIRQSMRYARRIQMATVSSEEEISEVFPNAMVYYKPCEIVSGDWYWAARLGSKRILALGGSARNGVPGALVSMMTVNALKDTVGQLSAMSVVSPTAILRTVQSKLPEAARHNAAGLSLCVFGRGSVRFAGVNQNAMLIKNGNPVVMHGDRPGDLFNTVTEGDVVMLYSASTKRELLDRDIKPEALCGYLSQQSPVGQKGAIEEMVSQRIQKEDVTVVSIVI